MPKNFNKVLGDVSNPVASRDQYLGNAADTAAGINSIVSSGAELQDQRILQKYASDLQGVESAGAGYAQQMADLNLKNTAASAQNDAATVAEIQQQMHRLRMGELNGTLSPTAANIRLQTLTKEWSTRYPHLQSEFKKLYQGSSVGGAGGGVKIELDEDPVLKANNKLMEDAIAEGISVKELLYRRKSKAAKEQAESDAAIAKENGWEVAPKLEQFADAVTQEAVDLSWATLRQASRDNKVDKDQWITGLGKGRSAVEFGLRKYFTNYELTGGRLDPEWKERVIKNATARFDAVIKAAEQTDTPDKLKRLAESEMAQRENRSEAEIEKMFPGPMYPLLMKSNDPMAIMESVEKIITAQQNKTGKALIDGISQYDTKTRALLRFIGEPAFREMSRQNIASVMENGPEGVVTTDPTFRKALTSQTRQAMRDVRIPQDKRENMAASVVLEDPNSVATDATIREFLAKSEAFRSRVTGMLAQGIEAAANDLDPADFDFLNFGEGDQDTGPVQTQIPQEELSPSDEASQTGGMYSYPAIARESQSQAQTFADRLNQFYLAKLAGGSTSEEAKAETGKLLDSALNTRTESAQRPTKRQKAEQAAAATPKEEDQRDILHNAVVTAAQAGKISGGSAARLLRELSGEDDPSIIPMSDGVYQDSITGYMYEVKQGILKVVKPK